MKNAAYVSRKSKKAWPTKEAMEQVYAKKLWGGEVHEFYSGIGSHHPAIIEPYIAEVTSFLKSFKIPLVVCDLGCGDFNVGKALVSHAKKYIAIDIVGDLIAHHQENFKSEKVEFHCLDIAVDHLPVGDCALLRQVLQHLSNTEIQAVISKLSSFKYVVLTEHLPTDDFVPNKEIISGQGTRLKKQSGVCLTAPPFHFKVKEEKQLLSLTSNDGKGKIVTTLYTLF